MAAAPATVAGAGAARDYNASRYTAVLNHHQVSKGVCVA